jgi:hypothetical protein
MIAANFENLLFLLLVAVAVLFQVLAKAAGKAGKDQTRRTSTSIPRTPSPMPRTPMESDEDRIRKFLEALGRPATSKPPPPVAPRTNIPSRPLAPVQPPIVIPTPAWQLKRERRKREVAAKEMPAPTVRRAEEIIPPEITTAPVFEVHEGPLPSEPPPIIKAPAEAYPTATRIIAKTPRTDVATLLVSTSGLRDAMILREILGPPRGLRAIDLL